VFLAQTSHARVEREYSTSGQTLVNPLLDCSDSELIFQELQPFEGKIRKLIRERIQRGAIEQVSVYFRDLNNGPWMGIDEDRIFTPASLLKIPIAISYYLYYEQDPNIFSETLQWSKPEKPESLGLATIVPGTPYTVRDLIERMLTHSDNAATYLLTERLPENLLLKPYKDLGLALPVDTDKDYSISIRNYSKIIRVLYNASYINRHDSEQILQMLTKSEFTEGLRAGVPRSVQVANKYGRRNHDTYSELHDCGIVYYPGAPYLLCVMTKGQDVDRMGDVIQSISALVYGEVDSQRSK
jgi:beta-lactamase class A